MKSKQRRTGNEGIALYIPEDGIQTKRKRYLRDGKVVHRTELMNESEYDLRTRYQWAYRGLVISFVALSRNWLWLINPLLIFGHSGKKPRYGKNACLLQDVPTGPRHVKLAWSHLVTVPRPQPLQRHIGMLLAGD